LNVRRWLATMAAAPAQSRPKDGKARYKAAPVGDEGMRARRASANRVLTMLKAALNHAFDEGHVSNRDAWGPKLKPFHGVEVARVRYLTVAEAQRLINASDPAFRPLLRAALETGCRYSELTRLEVHGPVASESPELGSSAPSPVASEKVSHLAQGSTGTGYGYHGFLSLRKLTFGRKIGVLKGKREARHAKQGSDRPGVAAAPAASLKQAPPTISWIASRREISDVILMQMLPFADTRVCRRSRLSNDASRSC
jgi:hypothetical protein